MGTTRRAQEVMGMNVGALRAAVGLTQAELAAAMRRIGFRWHRQTVTEVEAGHRPCTREEIAAVAAYFDMPPRAILVTPGGTFTGSEGAIGLLVGGQVLRFADWGRLWAPWVTRAPEERPKKDFWEVPAPRLQRKAIDALWKGESRPWADAWRRSGGRAVEAFARAREAAWEARRTHPGPIFLLVGDKPRSFTGTRPPWSEELRFEMQAGEPYVARDQYEAQILEQYAGLGLVRRISRQSAYRLRNKTKMADAEAD
jgi:transcriptional regulator with XRE-family HTH domain